MKIRIKSKGIMKNKKDEEEEGRKKRKEIEK